MNKFLNPSGESANALRVAGEDPCKGMPAGGAASGERLQRSSDSGAIGRGRERSILFSGPTVLAILAGRKTQTRRVAKPLPNVGLPAGDGWTYAFGHGGWGGLSRKENDGVSSWPLPRCPYGVPGDRLWVRETWRTEDWDCGMHYQPDEPHACTEPTEANPEAHFATFPEDLVTPCVLAGCPGGGVVLDPFGGTGTVARVAEDLGRKWVLLELNPEYAAMARRRMSQQGLLGRLPATSPAPVPTTDLADADPEASSDTTPTVGATRFARPEGVEPSQTPSPVRRDPGAISDLAATTRRLTVFLVSEDGSERPLTLEGAL